jgi:asparagine synthase (glutamine-hydrolysing)
MKRVQNTDRPMACLLSGGLDSSIITALVVQCRKELGYAEALETYSIGLDGGEDLRYASMVAAHLGTKHTTIVVDEETFFNSIPKVVYAIESYDTTTVRASVGNYLVAEYISKNSEAKVIFNGDGSDELTGGYLYFHAIADPIAADDECRRLLRNIHAFDCLRSDRCIASNGLEARTPFLDREFVQTYLTLSPEVRFPTGTQEKHLLRVSFGDLLPIEVANRTKEAFSDGVSPLNNSWFQIIQKRLPPQYVSDFNSANVYRSWFNPPTTPEQYYYRVIYNSYYSSAANVIPYYWMPRYVNAQDASARTYQNNLAVQS